MGVRIWANQLMIYAKDDPDFRTMAADFEAEDAMGMNKAEVAYSARDFPLILNRYCNLKQINVYTHGNVGYAHLDGGGLSARNADDYLPAPHAGLFSGKGRVLFIGCNVGQGMQGREFLIAAGQALLVNRGGFVGATNSRNFSPRGGLVDIYMPRWGNLRVIEFNAGGSVVNEKMF